jgi:hypothetical protein
MFDRQDRGFFGMQMCPRSEPILLPLAPTIALAIAEYLRLVTWEYYINLTHSRERSINISDCDSLANWQQNLPVRRVPTSQYQYVSPIAHQLAAKLQLTPLEICQNLQLCSFDLPSDRNSGMEIDVWYSEAGDIYFQLDPRSISLWLNYLHDLPYEKLAIFATRSIPATAIDASSLSVPLYAHARCRSQLALASAERIVSLSMTWQLTTPDWLVSHLPPQPRSDLSHAENRRRTQQTLIFDHQVEERLIHALMDVLDGLWSLHPEERIKTSKLHRFTLDLARCWLEFQRHCQIFDTTKSQNPHLAIARCGLTAICHRYLELLLEDCLGVGVLGEL